MTHHMSHGTSTHAVSVGLTFDALVQVFCLGKRVKEDLLRVGMVLKECYPPQMDIMNVYAGFYHRSFSARLTELATSGPGSDDCGYLLFWINHYYPR